MTDQSDSTLGEGAILSHMLQYDAWANREILAAAVDEAKVLRLLGHLMQAKQIWLMRVQGKETAQMNLWPTLRLDELRQSLPVIDRQWITQCDGEAPQRVVQYRNQSGKTFMTPLCDIVIHMANHGTYHRGQLATAVKNAGGTPAVTDYIVWSRAGRPRMT